MPEPLLFLLLSPSLTRYTYLIPSPPVYRLFYPLTSYSPLNFPSSISQKNGAILFFLFFEALFCTLFDGHLPAHSTRAFSPTLRVSLSFSSSVFPPCDGSFPPFLPAAFCPSFTRSLIHLLTASLRGLPDPFHFLPPSSLYAFFLLSYHSLIPSISPSSILSIYTRHLRTFACRFCQQRGDGAS
jgi:hypothetical protein